MKTEIHAVPTWALCYLVNGDIDYLEPGEQEMIDEWMERNHILNVAAPDDEESYFSYYPPFGLGCDVQDCICVTEW